MAKSGALKQLEWFGDALSSSSGFRSKSLKVVQYASRLLVWWAESQKRAEDGQSESAMPLDAVQSARSLGKAVGSARKIMNLGDCISDYFTMHAAIETAWADPGNATRFRNAVSAVSDFACDATTDWLLLASLTQTDESVPRWATRTNEISWAVSAAFGVVRAAHKVSEARAACSEAQARADANTSAVEAAMARRRKQGRRGDGSISSSQHLLRIATAQAASLRHSSTGSQAGTGTGELNAGSNSSGTGMGRRTASILRAAQWKETLAWVALTRASCEMVQAGPGAFQLDPPSEFLYLACGLLNGSLGVWATCVESD